MADETGQPGVPAAARGAAGGGKQGAGKQEAGAPGGDGPSTWPAVVHELVLRCQAEVTKLRDVYDRAVAAADEAAPPPAPPAPGPPRPEEPAAPPGQELDISGRPGPVTRSSP